LAGDCSRWYLPDLLSQLANEIERIEVRLDGLVSRPNEACSALKLSDEVIDCYHLDDQQADRHRHSQKNFVTDTHTDLPTCRSSPSPTTTASSQLSALTPPVEDCTLLTIRPIQRLLRNQPAGRDVSEQL
jgi:hypothetical protein